MVEFFQTVVPNTFIRLRWAENKNLVYYAGRGTDNTRDYFLSAISYRDLVKSDLFVRLFIWEK